MIALTAAVLADAPPRALAQTANADMARMSASNSRLQQEVASRLSRNHLLRGLNIMVTVDNSQVTLSGRVQNQEQWQEAESVTANVRGVRTILNNLTIAGANQNFQSQNNQDQTYQGNQIQTPPPPPEAQQPQAPPAPPSAAPAMSDAGNPPPPPPDQQPPQNNQSYGQQQAQNTQGYGQQPRPEYQGNGFVGQSYGNGYGAQNYNQYNGQNNYPPPQQSSAPVTVPAGTLLQVRTVETLDSAHLQPGQRFDATVANDVWEGNVLAIPRGAMLQGTVEQVSEPKGSLGGKPHLDLRLTSLNMGGQVYPLQTNLWAGVGSNKAGYTAGNTITGGVLGAIFGGIIGRGAGAAVGAGLGAVTGMGISSATKGPRIYIPSEAVLNFHLATPVTVQPVSWQEARRLASSVPQLQRRSYYGRYPRTYAYPYGYPYGYAYPAPYYYSPYPYYFGPSYYFGFGW